MKKVLIIAIVILSLLLAALAGLIWYQGSHVFVEGTACGDRTSPRPII